MRRKNKDKTLDEILTYGYMPERFTTAYLELVRVGMAIDPKVRSEYNESANVKRKFVQHGGGIKDERALRFKAWVDRQLRAIGRDMQAYLNARDGHGNSPIGVSEDLRREIAKEIELWSELKCRGGCGKYISWQWKHCAWCGKEIVNGSAIQGQSGDAGDRQSSGGTSEQETPAYRFEQSSGATGTNTVGEG